ncbi:MAG: hypothetical protein JXR48_04035 [Candidatus Delongbacteria bacterium]|nr:hypothetical protein [Candidatus Delongbacteria bacterium]
MKTNIVNIESPVVKERAIFDFCIIQVRILGVDNLSTLFFIEQQSLINLYQGGV